MTIFGSQSNLTPIQQAVEKDAVLFNMTFQGFVLSYKRGFDSFWRNPQFTPQEMAEAWGIQGLRLFMNSGATKDYILAIDSNALTQEYIDPPMTWQPEMDNGEPTGRIIVNE
jgi:hypothetical protein